MALLLLLFWCRAHFSWEDFKTAQVKVKEKMEDIKQNRKRLAPEYRNKFDHSYTFLHRSHSIFELAWRREVDFQNPKAQDPILDVNVCVIESVLKCAKPSTTSM